MEQTRAITRADVVAKRQTQLINEKCDLDERRNELMKELRMIEDRQAEIQLEYQMLEEIGDLSRVAFTRDSLSATIRSGRKDPSDRLHFDDAMRKIFDVAGRPMSVTEIIDRLEQFGWQWSGYQPAYNYITNSDMVEFAGKRGYYQLRRKW